LCSKQARNDVTEVQKQLKARSAELFGTVYRDETYTKKMNTDDIGNRQL